MSLAVAVLLRSQKHFLMELGIKEHRYYHESPGPSADRKGYVKKLKEMLALSLNNCTEIAENYRMRPVWMKGLLKCKNGYITRSMKQYKFIKQVKEHVYVMFFSLKLSHRLY
jgi:hypothetical protein